MINSDLSLFLSPIHADFPSGESIRYDAIYRQLQELRGSANATQETDYKTIEQMCENILKHTSKDLHVVAILTEAWANLYGLQGVTKGLELIVKLCEAFWDSIHPNNSDDIEVRLSIFIWVNDKLSDVVLKTPITKPKVPGIPMYTLANLIDARQLELVTQKSGHRKSEVMNQAMQEGRPSLAILAKSMMITPTDFYERLLSDIKFAVLAIERLEEVLDEKFQGESITLKGFDEYLVQIETYAEEVLEQKNLPTSHMENLMDASEEAQDDASHDVNVMNLSAERLYEVLVKVAERLEVLEPKSLAPKLIRKAVEWGNMSATELLNDLAHHNISLSEVTKILN